MGVRGRRHDGVDWKLCTRCKKKYGQAGWHPSSWIANGGWCKSCHNAYYRGQRRVRPPGYSYKYIKRGRERRAVLLAKLKSERGCMKCGERHPAALDFHHRDAREKSFNIAAMVGDLNVVPAMLAEIEKCDLLCSNCHRKLHYYEQPMAHWGKAVIARHAAYAALNLPPEKQRRSRGIHRRVQAPWRAHMMERFTARS